MKKPAISDKKYQNPSVSHILPSYELPFISEIHSFYNENKSESLEPGVETKRTLFNSYSIYLKNSIFHNDEETLKLRDLSVNERSFIWERYKTYGNKHFQKENFRKALFFYERALSCYKWLEIIKIDKKEEKSQDITDFDYEDTRNAANEESQLYSDNILLEFTDENLVLHDGQEIIDKRDKELRDSMLILTYLNMSVCYMKEGNFKEAMESVEDAKKLNERNSLIYFRRSQANACNLGSDLKQLLSAKEDIEKAIYLNQFEEKNEQKTYIEQAHFIEMRLKSQKEKIKKIIEELCDKIGTIENVEIVKDIEIVQEYEMILNIMKKYEENCGEFIEKKAFKEADNLRSEMMSLKQTINNMEIFLNLNFAEVGNNEIFLEVFKTKNIDYKNKVIISKLNILKEQKAKEFFSKAKFNQTIFENVINDLLKKKDEISKKMEMFKQEKKKTGKNKDKGFLQTDHFKINVPFKLIFQIFIILFSLFLFYYFNKDKSLFKKIFMRP